MADLGTIAPYDNHVFRPALVPITDYDVQRGRFIGVIAVCDNIVYRPGVIGMTDYVVRQIRILFRQLWPNRGQRFPQ